MPTGPGLGVELDDDRLRFFQRDAERRSISTAPAQTGRLAMLFHVRMDVHIPHDADPKHVDTLRRREARAQQLQRDGTWRHLWRIVGEYANISIFDVESSDKLHETF